MVIGEIIALGALLVSVLTLFRSMSKDSKGNASALTTVIIKLEAIGNDITEIKKDTRSVKEDIRKHSERITIAEQRIKALEKVVAIYHPSDITKE